MNGMIELFKLFRDNPTVTVATVTAMVAGALQELMHILMVG